jgi:hypothetical protein
MPKNFGLGRNQSPLDIRDYRLASFMPQQFGDLSGSMYWPFMAEPLDQKDTGHCCGFGGADFGINNPIADNYTNQTGHDFYYKCKIVDGEPNQENGSTVRSIAKVLQQEGRISNYAFASSVDEVTYWLLNKGPVIVGTEWSEDMFSADFNNIIHPTGNVVGGHCYLLNEKTSTDLYGIQNSWGDRWGIKGRAYISIDDFSRLFRSGGEVLAAVEEPFSAVSNKKDGCLTALLKMFGISI